MGFRFIAGNFINDIEAFCYLGKDTVLSIDDLAIEMDNPAEGSHTAAGFFKFGTDIPDARGFSGTCFSINKNI
jgi:hypothetical protein